MQPSQRWLRMTNHASQRELATQGVADLSAYNAEFYEWGRGEPIVIVPGLAGGVELLAPFARLLASNKRVIAFQSRGENDCFALRRGFSVDDLADDLAEFVAWLGLEKPVVFGVSFGGLVALAAAARHPSVFSSLAVQGVGLRFEMTLVQRIAGMVLSSYPLPADCRFLNQFFNLLFGRRPTPDQFNHAVGACWQTDQSVMAHRLRLVRRFNLERLVGQINVPTEVLSGPRDALVSPANAAALARVLPLGSHRVLEGSGHLAPVSHPALVVEALQSAFVPLPV
jgi:pimeloyl-ACP methyl ester carboxylesterase